MANDGGAIRAGRAYIEMVVRDSGVVAEMESIGRKAQARMQAAMASHRTTGKSADSVATMLGIGNEQQVASAMHARMKAVADASKQTLFGEMAKSGGPAAAIRKTWQDLTQANLGDTLGKQAKATGGGLDDLASSLIKFASVAVLGKLGFNALRAGFDRIEGVNDLSKKLQVGVGTADWIARSAEKAGVENPIDKIQELRRTIHDAAADPTGEKSTMLKGMGIDAMALSTKPLKEQLIQIANAFDRIANESDRAAYAASIFGRNGYEVLEMLKKLKEERTGAARVTARDVARQEMASRVGKEFKAEAASWGQTMLGWIVGGETVDLIEREVKQREKAEQAAAAQAAAIERAAEAKRREAERWAAWVKEVDAAREATAKVERAISAMEMDRPDAIHHDEELRQLRTQLSDPLGADPRVRAEVERRRNALIKRDRLQIERDVAESTSPGRLAARLREIDQRVAVTGIGAHESGMMRMQAINQALGGDDAGMSPLAAAKRKLAELRAIRETLRQNGVDPAGFEGRIARQAADVRLGVLRGAGVADVYGEYARQAADLEELVQSGDITQAQADKQRRALRMSAIGQLEPIRSIVGPAAMGEGSAEVYQTIARAQNASLQTKLQQEANQKLDSIDRTIKGLELPQPVRLP